MAGPTEGWLTVAQLASPHDSHDTVMPWAPLGLQGLEAWGLVGFLRGSDATLAPVPLPLPPVIGSDAVHLQYTCPAPPLPLQYMAPEILSQGNPNASAVGGSWEEACVYGVRPVVSPWATGCAGQGRRYIGTLGSTAGSAAMCASASPCDSTPATTCLACLPPLATPLPGALQGYDGAKADVWSLGVSHT